MDELEQVKRCEGFQWDRGNVEKNFLKHQVSPSESEQIFFNQPLIVTGDPGHSQKEHRFYALGQTDAGRLLFVSFTVRNKLIRVVSARAMSRQGRRSYEKANS
jgi:uncharacterized DUF497 family protein